MFAYEFPAWCHRRAGARHRVGDPLSFRHFAYGMTYLQRERAARALEQAGAVRIARAPDEDYRAWRADLKRGLE